MQEAGLSFHFVGSGDWTQVVRVTQKAPLPTGPSCCCSPQLGYILKWGWEVVGVGGTTTLDRNSSLPHPIQFTHSPPQHRSGITGWKQVLYLKVDPGVGWWEEAPAGWTRHEVVTVSSQLQVPGPGQEMSAISAKPAYRDQKLVAAVCPTPSAHKATKRAASDSSVPSRWSQDHWG